MSKIKIGDETINFIEINPEYGPILNKKISSIQYEIIKEKSIKQHIKNS
jgi:hypothetical protein